MLIPAIMGFSLALASESNCTQNRLDGSSIPATTSKIFPSQQVIPFYQWENNNGYCGEVSLMQAGMNNGQWMSQSNARLICGSGLSQSGPDGWCAAHKLSPNFNAQMLLETPATGVTGVHVYSNAQACLLNARLSATTFLTLQDTNRLTLDHPGIKIFCVGLRRNSSLVIKSPWEFCFRVAMMLSMIILCR